MKNLKAKILYAEDREEDAYLTNYALETIGLKDDVHWVKDGQEAIDYLTCQGSYKDRPDIMPTLVLLDLKMPKVDGLEVIEFIKSHDKLKIIPVVVMTTSIETVDRKRAFDNYVNSYIQKPLDSDEFMKVVEAIGKYWIGMDKNPLS